MSGKGQNVGLRESGEPHIISMFLKLILNKVKTSVIFLTCQNKVNLCSWLQLSNENKTLRDSWL